MKNPKKSPKIIEIPRESWKIIENHQKFNHFDPKNFNVHRKMLSKFQEKIQRIHT